MQEYTTGNIPARILQDNRPSWTRISSESFSNIDNLNLSTEIFVQRKRPIEGEDRERVPANSNQTTTHHNVHHHNQHQNLVDNQKASHSRDQVDSASNSGGSSNMGSDLKRFRPSNEPSSNARLD